MRKQEKELKEGHILSRARSFTPHHCVAYIYIGHHKTPTTSMGVTSSYLFFKGTIIAHGQHGIGVGLFHQKSVSSDLVISPKTLKAEIDHISAFPFSRRQARMVHEPRMVILHKQVDNLRSA
jgi:hypothetical protein